ncbi:type II secretion system protein [Paenibacillus sp. GCM10023248]|uniref:type II secretion system protein n=1 Tax=unclassified Paenibacillus TaxID=185978 RepID=UPI002377E79F|nr:type II secretion system protein [Paenibacillus sp. MAHUQ-63]MDD9267825.1 type II secretion system protein [Paenibacillus sp. MAHUQ-63]
MLIKMMNRLKKEEKGFTLIELLAVIVILAVIAAIAVPYILGVINKSKDDADVATARQLYDAAKLYVTAEKGGVFKNVTITLSDLKTGKYIENDIMLPSTKEPLSSASIVFKNDDSGELTSVKIETTTLAKEYTGPNVLKSSATGATVSIKPTT